MHFPSSAYAAPLLVPPLLIFLVGVAKEPQRLVAPYLHHLVAPLPHQQVHDLSVRDRLRGAAATDDFLFFSMVVKGSAYVVDARNQKMERPHSAISHQFLIRPVW